MKTQSLVQYLGIPCSFGFECRTTIKFDQMAENSLGKGRGLDYEDSPTWITQFRVRMRKLWYLEGEKVREKIMHLCFSNFSSWNEWEGKEIFKIEIEGILVANEGLPHHHPVRGMWASWDRGIYGSWASRAPHGLPPKMAFGHCLPPLCSSRVLQRYSGLQSPNLNLSSDYKLWLPHAQGRLQNFDKKLRIWLGIRRRRQHYVWELK